MPLAHLTLQWRITLLSGLCLLAVVAALIGASAYQNQSSAKRLKEQSSQLLGQAAVERLQAQAVAHGQQVERFFNETALYGEGFAQQVLQLREQTLSGRLTVAQLRQTLIGATRETLEKREKVLGLYVILLPDALAGPDAAWRGQRDLAGNETGRFALYWSQSQPGRLVQEVLSEAQINANTAPPGSEPANAWYTCPQAQRRTCVVEPYTIEVEGRKVLMSSISIPLISNGKTLGVVGMDISLDTLQKLAANLGQDLYQGNSEVSIVSSAGQVAGRSGEVSATALDIRQAVQTVAGNPPWQLQIKVPQALVQAPARQMQSELDEKSREANWLNLGLGLLASSLGMLLIWLAAYGVTRPLLKMAGLLDAIVEGDGDLTQRLPAGGRDELGQLATGFNRFLDTLQPIIRDIQAVCHNTRNSADTSSGIARDVSAGMQNQYREVELAATALHEMSTSAQEVARHSHSAANAATAAENASRSGQAVFSTAERSIEALDQRLETTLKQVHDLAVSSTQIGQVLDVISSIAQQTNLLALNAAIEAARAGEQGRGFAVVADEVRHLASNTQSSVEQVRTVIETLQQLSQAVVHSTQLSREQAGGSVLQVQQTRVALEHISQAVDVIEQMNQQIASAALEQSTVVEDISRRVSDIRGISETLTRRMSDASKASDSLHQMANHQQQLVGHFRV
ncbi:HAMP domain-containing protein [Pseudomonas gessardii]|uniref:HAMP domain-containing protein n=2 Tax=Pseudomonas gessardii TaxID=78544 RepID=A0ABS9FA17_9PSED|nr:methyl-accepting chemotaxis protein [Pseudomonas gessardii]MCF4978674.1 HAMP domain-containing protein [Pseudomonas gessardii]MCF4993033.1 HAMP domain-containing protein [Pseudomonas gessardii]MCF5086372.1 HAMP domain-containing protein [Pseudomonas gessardii]MCF5096399.1 HAMP domain-containing protein [Pseudomonas gessardii]MCF5109157.1 HAMP domain-containing protein [Pseudomonas gessardii]